MIFPMFAPGGIFHTLVCRQRMALKNPPAASDAGVPAIASGSDDSDASDNESGDGQTTLSQLLSCWITSPAVQFADAALVLTLIGQPRMWP